ncbi:MAG TPA: recombinase family protein, partial [Flavipsychrobacter sp.]|nr:recombinase family protein [Flavipsychrobacter sp.]
MYKPIAIYARVSTARQEEEETIKTQIDCLTQYAASNGLTIIKEYLDDGWSGDTLIRPSLDNLRQEAKNASWEAIL